MEILTGKTFDGNELKNRLVQIGDFVNYEGPLLSLFLNLKDYQPYLFLWSGNDKKVNRWLVYRSTTAQLNKFINEQITHLDLLLSVETFCYSVEIDNDLNWLNCLKIEKNNLPKSFLPSTDSFFDKTDCPDFTKLTEFIKYSDARRSRA